MQFTIGLDAKLYQGPAGSSATLECTQVQDVTLNLEMAEAKANSRATKFALSDVALLTASIDFSIIWDETDSNFLAMWTAFTGRTALAFKCLSKTSGKGLDADFKLHKFVRKESLEEGEVAEVSIKPCPSTRLPAFV
jgi:hypothetical protein